MIQNVGLAKKNGEIVALTSWPDDLFLQLNHRVDGQVWGASTNWPKITKLVARMSVQQGAAAQSLRKWCTPAVHTAGSIASASRRAPHKPARPAGWPAEMIRTAGAAVTNQCVPMVNARMQHGNTRSCITRNIGPTQCQSLVDFYRRHQLAMLINPHPLLVSLPTLLCSGEA